MQEEHQWVVAAAARVGSLQGGHCYHTREEVRFQQQVVQRTQLKGTEEAVVAAAQEGTPEVGMQEVQRIAHLVWARKEMSVADTEQTL